MNKVILFNHPPKMFSIETLRETIKSEEYILKETTYPATNIENIIAASKDCSAIICASEKWDKYAINQIKDHIKILAKYGVGYDNIDVEYAEQCGIPVFNIAGMNSAAVAEATLIHILNLLRKFKHALDVSKEKNKDFASLFGDQLDGKIIGIIGIGNIARHLIRMMSGFKVKIIAYDAYVDKSAGKDLGIEMADSMDEIFKNADVVSLHIPLNKETKKMINKQYFEMMKEGSLFVNTCRGGVVDEKDLYNALINGRPAAAGIDVVEAEPITSDNLLLSLPNAYVTPHFAACTNQAEHDVQVMLGKVAPCFFRGEKFGNIVNPGYIKYVKNKE
jgi:D-3-phosphoglycerate dehydrogenase